MPELLSEVKMQSIFDIPSKGQTPQMGGVGFGSLIDEVSGAHGVDPKLIRAIMQTESGFNPNATTPGSSASGLMQLVKETASDMGVKNVFDPRENITGGVKYFKQQLDSAGGDVDKALAMYNQGPGGNLSKAQDYVGKVKSVYGGQPSTPQSMDVDMGSLVEQYGKSPYPEAKVLEKPPLLMTQLIDPTRRGFTQASNPLVAGGPELLPTTTGKLPFGFENTGGPVERWSKDVLYGLGEFGMQLGAGLIGLPAAAIGGTAKAITSGPEAGGETFNQIAHAAMGDSNTTTAKVLMRPFEVVFGGILNTGAEYIKDSYPNATPEELDHKIKATQFFMNLAMIAPMFKGALKGKGKIDPAKAIASQEITAEGATKAKSQILNDPNVAPEVKVEVEGIDVAMLNGIKDKAAKKVAIDKVKAAPIPEVKFAENQSIVEGLLMEVELREGRAKITMRKAAKIVADMDGDVGAVDLKGVKGINPDGSTGKAIKKLLEERDAAATIEASPDNGMFAPPTEVKGEAPLTELPITPKDIKAEADFERRGIYEVSPAPVEPVKSLEDIPSKGEAPSEVPVTEPIPVSTNPIEDANALAYGPTETTYGQSSMPKLSAEDIAKAKTLESPLIGRLEEALQPHDFNVNDVLNMAINAGLKDGIKDGVTKIIGESSDSMVRDITKLGALPFKNLLYDLIGKERERLLGEEAKPTISEFTDIKMAKGEGYTFLDSDRYSSLEKAQAKAKELGDDHEVVKVGKVYKVTKYVEDVSYPEFASEVEANAAGFDVLSEIKPDKVNFYQPGEGGTSPIKIGNKYYRTTEFADMPDTVMPEEVSTKEVVKKDITWEDDISPDEWASLEMEVGKATLDEIRAKDRLKALENVEYTPESMKAKAQAFAEWRDSLVTKCNVAQTPKKSASPKTPITKEALAIAKDDFKSFESEQVASEWMMANDTYGKLVEDPETGRWSIVNAEKFKSLDELDMMDEGVEQLTGRSESMLDGDVYPDSNISDTGVRDLFDIFNNESGSADLTPLRGVVDMVESTLRVAEKMGKSIDEYLAHIGADEAAAMAFKAAMARVPQMKQELMEKDPVTSSILMPEGKVVAQTINRNKNKEVTSVGPPITEALANKAMSANRDMQWGSDIVRKDPITGKISVEHTSNGFEKAMQSTEIKINSFRSAGLSDVYSMWREAKNNAHREKVEVKAWIDNLESQIAPERRGDFAIAAYANMKSVKEAFNTMGITEIPQLTPKEGLVLEQLLDYTRKFRDRSNYIRTHTGQKAIPKLLDMNGKENYLPLMRDLNVLRDMGLAEGLTISDSKKLGELSKKFNGMFNPNSKKRHVSDIPIELNPFNALRRHAEYGLDEIHISPVAALAKDLANLKLPRIDGGKGKISLTQWNPYLSRMLSRWSDQIVGKDVVATALANANPFFAWGKDRLTKNLVVATIGGSLRTVLVQPTSYIIGIPTMLDLRSTGYGIMKLMAERPFGKSNARQNSSILNIREADYNFKELSDYIQQGKMSGTVGYLAEKSLKPMKWVDSIMAEAGWNAARYYGEKRLKLQGKELYRFADDVVERTQGMGVKGAVSDIQSSAATKWLTLLQTFAIADFNLIARDVLGIKNPEASQGKTIIRVAKYAAATILAGQLYKMIGLNNVVPDPIGAYLQAKKDNKGDLRAVGAAAGELLEKIPVIGGSAKYSSHLFGIAGEWGKILPEAGEKFSASLDWDKLTPKQRSYNVRLIARAVGMTAGIPMTNQILKSINSAYKGGNPYQIILGVYDVKKKRSGGSLRPEIPRPPLPPRPF